MVQLRVLLIDNFRRSIYYQHYTWRRTKLLGKVGGGDDHINGLPVYTVIRNDRERTLHRNMLLLLALRCDSGSILPNLAEFENTENPELNQVDNFSDNDGEVDQPVYEGPQTRSCTRKLMKANCLMADLFDMIIDMKPKLAETGEICADVSDVIVVVSEVNDKSIRDLVLEFWYKHVFTFYCVCCDLAEAGAHSIYC